MNEHEINFILQRVTDFTFRVFQKLMFNIEAADNSSD